MEPFHLEKTWEGPVGEAKFEEKGPLRVVVSVRHPITSASSIEQKIILTATSPYVEFDTTVFWHENRTVLKAEFPVAVTSDYATYETQFGYIKRPTHYNTSWDLAKFEVFGQKFVDLSEPGYGVSLITERPLKLKPTGTNNGPIADGFFALSSPNVVLDTLKVAESPRLKSRGLDVVIRLYESYGGRTETTLITKLAPKEAKFCNILEDLEEDVPRDSEGNFKISFGPFEFKTIRLLL
ncbi:hypothetical protein HDU96_005635 [Phlyctochytrium bullatum]|nr:hypothetical protein HDU96_005635 [Phlyctochytrium bullatum]